jgi:FAD:protein FMN transferase
MTDRVDMVALSLAAMATRFELVLYGDDPVRLRACGEEALDEIERLERQLSFYSADSEISWINTRAAYAPVRVDPRLFRLLERCARASAATNGAFDVTIGPLVHVWNEARDQGRLPDSDRIARARAAVGMRNVELLDEDFTVRFAHPDVQLDLGAFGKGYAIERAIGVLRENGATRALLHGGTSSVYGLGTPPGDASWRVGLSDPFDAPPVELADAALSVSAVHGREYEVDGVRYGHVLDPRTGAPVRSALASAVTGPSPAECEALSTALLVLGRDWLDEMHRSFPGYRGLAVAA